MRTLALALLPALALASPAQAYIGPGAGIGAIATMFALVAVVILLVVGFVWYPVKRLLNRNRKPTGNDSTE
ncbi:hypothetical protein CLV78_104280 [Aliiruegeria haliotis]|uniref:Uncharacterized protein n=1 Tax=Aliiruegeria haliotis TaxID=1280846 RepID=A0A2T0RRI8_9RHOB|nr:hypothetical protein [Aliiruegeria haliotis]PRY23788.1 hypothetical protein CLV78_104280 [Aliiruegeria haliotis]